MSDIAIFCESLSKRYRIGQRESYKALRDVISEAAAAPFRRMRGSFTNGNSSNPNGNGNGWSINNEFWALKDVSFHIKRGEVVGIIGRNGAGKSTLLKILSRITKPTSGHAEIHGRVGSLLEVGTGFHPELTGRENIYLNGAILGMRKAEIERKFDEIVAFAEVEKFIDTPVKRYSSGMYVRLAFAVAAHMDTEVLLVDEVLSVGDSQFQKKSLGKIGDVVKEGRTVLFVSHSMSAIQNLCTKAILLGDGRIKSSGEVKPVVVEYLANSSTTRYENRSNGSGQTPLIKSADVEWRIDEQLKVTVTFESPFELRPPILGLVIRDTLGIPIFGTNGRFDLQDTLPAAMTSGSIEVAISTDALRPDVYTISLWLGDQFTDYCHLDQALRIEVGAANGEAAQPSRTMIGNARLKSTWRYFNH